jgi:hypothetical protein
MQYDMHTRRETAAAIEEAGIGGHAVECLLTETAAARHEWRVEAAIAAASAEAVKQGYDDDAAMGAAAILVADTFGVGGTGNCAGDGTIRHAGLRALGTGRKHARDGGAWNVAIREAALRLLNQVAPDATWLLVARAGNLSLEASDGMPGVSLVGLVDVPWVYTIAREGLRRATGVGQWFENPVVGFSGSAQEWAEAVNTSAIRSEEYYCRIGRGE